MKKFLLALMATAAFTASAQTLTLDKTNVLHAPAPQQDAPALAPSRAADGYTLRFCGDIYSWYPLGSACTWVQYITIPGDIATCLAGNKVTSISFSISLETGNKGAAYTVPGKIFVTEDPEASTLDSLVFNAQADVDIYDSYQSAAKYQTGTFAAGSEYVIKENTPFSFGVMFNCTAADYPIGVDNTSATQFAGVASVYQNGSYAGYVPVGEATGANLMMYAVTKGEKTELLDIATVLGTSIEGFDLPIYARSNDKSAYFILRNYGSNSLSTLNYSYKVNDGENKSADLNVNVAAGKTGVVALPLDTLPAGHNNVTVSLNKVNGKEITPVEAKLQYINLDGAQAYERKFVVEEFTGTWCGFCPRGIVGMDYMQSTYPDKFIGIAVHASGGSSATDKFQVSNYMPFVQAYAAGFPSGIVNRDLNYLVDPSKEMLGKCYGYWTDQVAPATIDFACEVVEKNLEVKATAKFGFDDKHAYKMAIVLTEDGLTGYQTNYFADPSNGLGAMDGWENKASKVSWTYTHTAIDIDAAFGNELADSVEAGKEYEAKASFLYLGAMGKEQFNIDNTHAIALLFDAETGVVVNAAKFDLSALSGVSDAVALPEGPAAYYNIQGQKVANPQRGQLYIRVQGDKATKVLY